MIIIMYHREHRVYVYAIYIINCFIYFMFTCII